MAYDEELPYIVIERRTGGFSGFVWGALLGAGVAFFLAPRSGRETQEELRRGVQRLRSVAEDRVDEARGAVNRTRGRIQDGVESVRSTVELQVDQARQAVEAGRRAAREAREDLERRVAEAREGYATAAGAVRGDAPPVPDADVVVTEVVVEETDSRAAPD